MLRSDEKTITMSQSFLFKAVVLNKTITIRTGEKAESMSQSFLFKAVVLNPENDVTEQFEMTVDELSQSFLFKAVVLNLLKYSKSQPFLGSGLNPFYSRQWF
jgi:hypothetical protein